MQIKQTEVFIPTPDGQMPAVLMTAEDGHPHAPPFQGAPYFPGWDIRETAGAGERMTPNHCDRKPAILLLMEAFGLTSYLRDVATRIANEGYVVLVPDLYYRELPNNKFGYDKVEQAMAMMWRLDFGTPMENDLRAALAWVKIHPEVNSDRIGVTGFCLGGGLTFFTACKFSNEIAAAAPFYGVVLDEWIDAVKNITIPVYLFFGGCDPFIPGDRIQQIHARFQELGKDYNLKVYPEAGHGFFCNERSDYNHSASEDAWHELTEFFQQYL